MNFENAAERLMAATTQNRDGSFGVDWMEWKDYYMNSPSMDKERKVIADWLKGFAVEAVRDAEEQRAAAEMKKLMDDIGRMKS